MLNKVKLSFVAIVATIAVGSIGCSKKSTADKMNDKIGQLNDISAHLQSQGVNLNYSSASFSGKSTEELNDIESNLSTYISLGEDVMSHANDKDVFWMDSYKLSDYLSNARSLLSQVQSAKSSSRTASQMQDEAAKRQTLAQQEREREQAKLDEARAEDKKYDDLANKSRSLQKTFDEQAKNIDGKYGIVFPVDLDKKNIDQMDYEKLNDLLKDELELRQTVNEISDTSSLIVEMTKTRVNKLDYWQASRMDSDLQKMSNFTKEIRRFYDSVQEEIQYIGERLEAVNTTVERTTDVDSPKMTFDFKKTLRDDFKSFLSPAKPVVAQ